MSGNSNANPLHRRARRLMQRQRHRTAREPVSVAAGLGNSRRLCDRSCRVPVNVHKGKVRSLEQARAAGANVQAIASPLDALRIARAHPERAVVLFAVGFETPTAPVAAMLLDSAPDNLFVLLAATFSVLHQIVHGHRALENCYREVVRPGGNAAARQQIARVMDVVDANWRGIGIIPGSGFRLNAAFAMHDARRQFPLDSAADRKRAGQMPPGCDCARVVLGQIYPAECRLYGRACTPRSPVGPCMVSDEGACRIWWANRARAPGTAAEASQ